MVHPHIIQDKIHHDISIYKRKMEKRKFLTIQFFNDTMCSKDRGMNQKFMACARDSVLIYIKVVPYPFIAQAAYFSGGEL